MEYVDMQVDSLPQDAGGVSHPQPRKHLPDWDSFSGQYQKSQIRIEVAPSTFLCFSCSLHRALSPLPIVILDQHQ
jgi:hypothetical protein